MRFGDATGGFEIAHEPGDSYEQHGEPEQFEQRADARAEAVRAFRENASKQTVAQLRAALAPVFGLVIQLRAIGGSAADTNLGPQLRELADFLDDL